MGMSRIFDSDQRKAARIVDAEREARLERYGAEIEQLIRQERENFRPAYALARLGIDPNDRADALERAYELAVRRTYRDQAVSDNERRALDWLAARLDLDGEHRKAAELRVGCDVFERYLDQALGDGIFDGGESRTLQHIAAGLGSGIDELIQTYFARRGAEFLRGLFAAILRDGDISDSEWAQLSQAAEGLGSNQERLASIIGGQAERYVEQLMGDAQAAGTSAAEVRRALESLARRLPLSPKFREQLDARFGGRM